MLLPASGRAQDDPAVNLIPDAPADKQTTQDEQAPPGGPDESDQAAAAEVPTRRLTTTEMIGWRSARFRLGRNMPTGTGIITGHVEGLDHAYMPNAENERFEGIQWIGRSGESMAADHATKTARVIYGQRGMARGVTTVHCFGTDHWLTLGYLRTGLPVPPAANDPIRVFNHSWVSSRLSRAEEVLRRVDYQADQRDVIFCVGVDNRRNSAVPKVLASGYNVIAVGTAGGSGASSGGYTRVEGVGRCKPDIVGARQLTSFTTAQVTSAAILLLEVADRIDAEAAVSATTEPQVRPISVEQGADDDAEAEAPPPPRIAARSEVVKAVLMAGATKPDLWQPANGHPLDEHMGAGLVNIDNSLQIMEHRQSPPGDVDGDFGWHFHAMEPGEQDVYRFERDGHARELSLMAVWNRRIAGDSVVDLSNGQRYWDDTPRLADFELRLVRIEDDQQVEVAASDSAIDNVEHIYVRDLPAGLYQVELIRKMDGHDEPWDVALAWRWAGEQVNDGR